MSGLPTCQTILESAVISSLACGVIKSNVLRKNKQSRFFLFAILIVNAKLNTDILNSIKEFWQNLVQFEEQYVF